MESYSKLRDYILKVERGRHATIERRCSLNYSSLFIILLSNSFLCCNSLLSLLSLILCSIILCSLITVFFRKKKCPTFVVEAVTLVIITIKTLRSPNERKGTRKQDLEGNVKDRAQTFVEVCRIGHITVY